jgi:A/G-specific adenine glycosylase
MLQQTTVKAVLPYYNAFLKQFPDVNALSKAKESDVLKMWAGLGYYSRAKSLYKASQVIARKGFPDNYQELIQLPGLGPYTSRAIASAAFGEKVGVLDGNSIRFLSRVHGLKLEWWKTAGRNKLQEFADRWADCDDPANINQALMEMGATICLPQNPQCMLCPFLKDCQAKKKGFIEKLPLKKPKREIETWLWQPLVHLQEGKVLIVKNDYAPFLKDQWFLPGKAKRQKTPPQKYDFTHTITHHKIYVKLRVPIQKGSRTVTPRAEAHWISPNHLNDYSPASLMKKVFDRVKY